MKKEIIMGICHLLEQHHEPEILHHTVIALSHLSMNSEFASSELSSEVMKRLVPLVTIFKDKDLYVLLVTISKLIELNIHMFQNFPKILLEIIKDEYEKKDLLLAVTLVLKELICNSEIYEQITKDKEL